MSYGFYLLSQNSPESLVGYAPLYGGVWVSARVFDKWQQNNNVNVSANHTDTETTTTSTSIEQKILAEIGLSDEQVDKIKASVYTDKD